MLVKIGWSLWAIAPAIAIALHFGPGQKWMKRDLASDRMQIAQRRKHRPIGCRPLLIKPSSTPSKRANNF